MNENVRIGKDGNPAEDSAINQKAVERKVREAGERERLEAEAREPWSRTKVEREITRSASQESLGVINGENITNRINLHGVDLSGLDLSGLDLSKANLHGAKLVGTNLSGCRLVGANLHGADLADAEMEDVNAVEANFNGACLCRAKVNKTHFMKANLSECCHEACDGLDVEEKPLTSAEEKKAQHLQSEGFRTFVDVDQGKVRYFGSTLDGANVTGMSSTCKTRKS